MIAKRYRLTFREVKKVLAHGKPFFASAATALVLPGKAGWNRFAIVVSGKHARGSVIRNVFRRSFYGMAAQRLAAAPGRAGDCVLILKRGTVLDHRKPECVAMFVRDVEAALAKAFPAPRPAAPSSRPA